MKTDPLLWHVVIGAQAHVAAHNPSDGPQPAREDAAPLGAQWPVDVCMGWQGAPLLEQHKDAAVRPHPNPQVHDNMHTCTWLSKGKQDWRRYYLSLACMAADPCMAMFKAAHGL